MTVYADIKRNPVMTTVISLVVLGILIELSLLLSGRRVLVNETYVPPTEEVIMLDFYQSATGPEFECSYFTGRQIVSVSISADAFDECPFIAVEGLGLKL